MVLPIGRVFDGHILFEGPCKFSGSVLYDYRVIISNLGAPKKVDLDQLFGDTPIYILKWYYDYMSI